MNDKVLTDDEKNALLEGVQSGEVEVQSSAGPIYASVVPFEIGPRARITKDSYPRLQLLTQQVADKLSRRAEQLLQCDVAITPGEIRVRSFSEYCVLCEDPSVVVIFSAEPLIGNALIVMESAMVRQLVDAFFGGVDNEGETALQNTFTPGELSVSNLFANVVLSTSKEVWSSLIDISPDRLNTEINLDLVDMIAETDPVVGTEFFMSFCDKQCVFRILWPYEMVEPLVPAFDGQKKDRDAAEDARWENAICKRIADSVVQLTTNVGHSQMTLGDLINLNPGDVIEIDSPEDATVLAKQVPLLHGKLGVHQGRNAVETIEWLDQQQM